MKEVLEKFYYHKTKEKEHKAKAKELNQKLKDYLRENNEKEMKGEGYKVEYYISKRKKLNEDKLVEVFKDKGLEEYIDYKPQVKEKDALGLIKEGKIEPEELEDIIQVREIENLRLKEE